MNEDYNEIIEKLPFWKYLTCDEKRKFINNKKMVHFSCKQQICGGECDCLGLSIVVTGVLRAYLLSPDGREITLYRIRAGEACLASAHCVLHSLSFESHVEVEEECEIILLPCDVYSELIKNNIYVECESYKMGSERYSDVIKAIERITFMSLEQRLALCLLDQSKTQKSNIIKITHEKIASDIGSARAAVSRELKNMESSGKIKLLRGKVELLDKAAFKKPL